METSNILKQTKLISRSVLSKMKYFICAYIFVTSFIETYVFLDWDEVDKKINPNYLLDNSIWLYFAYILKIAIISGSFGFYIGYFLKRINLLNKIIIAFLYLILKLLLAGIINSVVYRKFEILFGDSFSQILFGYSYRFEPVFNTVVISSSLIMVVSVFYFIGIGNKIYNYGHYQKVNNLRGVKYEIGNEFYIITLLFLLSGILEIIGNSIN